MSLSSVPRHKLDAALASRLAGIALGHVTREYPNTIAHVAPKAVHPIFYGSYDWHSCVHSYWLLATLRRLFPSLDRAGEISALFDRAITRDTVAGELRGLEESTRRGFERPYGWAWFLMLQAELLRQKSGMTTRLAPLAELFVTRFTAHLPKATYPVRSGVHSSTAFALALVAEYAAEAKDAGLIRLVTETAQRWYAADRDCQAWEPSGEDFLSPALTEAECMRRILPTQEFAAWFRAFLPRLSQRGPGTLFQPAQVSDRSDGRIVHLDGLNLSRAWCWRRLGNALLPDDPIRAIAADAAERHLDASLPHISGDYMGEHWLASFALLALTA